MPTPEIRALVDRAAPAPSGRLHFAWLRFGVRLSGLLFAVALVLMCCGAMQSSDERGDDVQRWALFVALIALAGIVLVVGERVIVRLIQVMALFHSDVPPSQYPRAGRQQRRDADAVASLYRRGHKR